MLLRSTTRYRDRKSDVWLFRSTIRGARALGMEKEIGSLEAGKRADLITVRIDRAHATPLYDAVSRSEERRVALPIYHSRSARSRHGEGNRIARSRQARRPDHGTHRPGACYSALRRGIEIGRATCGSSDLPFAERALSAWRRKSDRSKPASAPT